MLRSAPVIPIAIYRRLKVSAISATELILISHPLARDAQTPGEFMTLSSIHIVQARICSFQRIPCHNIWVYLTWSSCHWHCFTLTVRSTRFILLLLSYKSNERPHYTMQQPQCELAEQISFSNCFLWCTHF